MLIKQIMDADIANCYEVMENDEQLKIIDDKLYSLLSELPKDVNFEMEATVSEYMARVIRIAYLQGIFDFTRLFVVLRENPQHILQKYVDV